MKTIAIIPAFNEHRQLQAVVSASMKYVDHVIVIDDGSRQPLINHVTPSENLTVLRHSINLGKGAALKTGIFWARQTGYEVAVLLDADGQHNPDEVPRILAPIISGTAEIVFGIRSFHQDMPYISRLGNIFLTRMMKVLYRIQVDDTQSGFRAILLSSFNKIDWQSARYAVETEMIVNAGKHALSYAQVPITTIYHDKYKGTTVIDGIRILFNILKWRLL